jgi:hypothetical protein
MPGTGVTETDLRLYDNTGRMVSSGEYGNIFPGVLTLELPWLTPGIYHYHLRTDSVTYTGTVIKIDTK